MNFIKFNLAATLLAFTLASTCTAIPEDQEATATTQNDDWGNATDAQPLVDDMSILRVLIEQRRNVWSNCHRNIRWYKLAIIGLYAADIAIFTSAFYLDGIPWGIFLVPACTWIPQVRSRKYAEHNTTVRATNQVLAQNECLMRSLVESAQPAQQAPMIRALNNAIDG